MNRTNSESALPSKSAEDRRTPIKPVRMPTGVEIIPKPTAARDAAAGAPHTFVWDDGGTRRAGTSSATSSGATLSRGLHPVRSAAERGGVVAARQPLPLRGLGSLRAQQSRRSFGRL